MSPNPSLLRPSRPLKFHFVCTGNIFRSRLAEALAKSLHSSSFLITSSGTNAAENYWGSIGWFTQQVLKENQILPFASPRWIQTTSTLLKNQDFIVFLQPYHLQYCQLHFGYSNTNHQVWDIADILLSMSDQQLLDHTRSTFTRLQPLIRQVLSDLKIL